jgi:membrane protein DedA with SNARE-associated domain
VPLVLYSELTHLISIYGYWAVAAIIGLECVGLPVPGEAVLIAAAIYAGSTHDLNIFWVIIVAALSGILGSNFGYWIGQEGGYRLLLRYGHYIRLTEGRVKLGQYLFQHHGGTIVFFSRFVPVLRVFAALLAGANHMAWPRFVLFNATGGIFWAIFHGVGGYYFGEHFQILNMFTGIASAVGAVLLIGGALIFLRRYETRLQLKAERTPPKSPPPL